LCAILVKADFFKRKKGRAYAAGLHAIEKKDSATRNPQLAIAKTPQFPQLATRNCMLLWYTVRSKCIWSRVCEF